MIQRLFMSAHGKAACEPHMLPGDRYLPTAHSLTHGEHRGGIVHVVAALPETTTLGDLSHHGVRIVRHDWIDDRGECEVPCPFSGSATILVEHAHEQMVAERAG